MLEDNGRPNWEMRCLGKPKSEPTLAPAHSETISESTWPAMPDDSLSEYPISSNSRLKTSPAAEPPATATASESEALTTPSTKAFSPSYFLRDLTEAIESGLNHLNAIYKKIPLADPLKKVLLVSAGASLAAASVAYPVIAAGAGAICVWQAALRFEKNNHGRAVAIMGSTLYTLHMSALGFHELAICNLSGALRSVAQSMIADDKPKARFLTAAIGFAATVGVYSAVANVLPLFSLNNVPLLTLGIGAMSGAFSQKYSWASRAAGLSGCGFSIAYHLLVTHSSVGLLATAMFIPGIAWSIWEYDIAKKKELHPRTHEDLS